MRKRTNILYDIEEVLKKLLNEEYEGKERIQMFDCIGFTPDHKETLYINNESRVAVLHADGYRYVEVLGLSDDEYRYIFEKYGY